MPRVVFSALNQQQKNIKESAVQHDVTITAFSTAIKAIPCNFK